MTPFFLRANAPWYVVLIPCPGGFPRTTECPATHILTMEGLPVKMR